MLSHFLTIYKRQGENESQEQGLDESVLCWDLRRPGSVAMALVKPPVHPFLGLIPHLSNEDLGQCAEYAQRLSHKS